MPEIREIRVTASVDTSGHVNSEDLVITDALTNQEIKEIRSLDLYFEPGVVWNATTLVRVMLDSEGLLMYDDEGEEKLWHETVVIKSININ